MIKNDKQYQVTKSKLIEFKKAVALIQLEEIDPLLKELQVGAISSQIEDFEKELKEYENLKDGITTDIFVNTLPELYEALIKARIAKNWTQADLAKHLELKEQQIQRYEACNYSTASIVRFMEVAAVLDISAYKIKIKVNEPIFETPEGIEIDKISKMRANRMLLDVA
jgi:transcriptional regulator with XRE-family HTH domain